MADVIGLFKGQPLAAPTQAWCPCGACKVDLIHDYDQRAHEFMRDHPELRDVESEEDAMLLTETVWGACAMKWLRGSCPRVVPPQRKRGFPVQAVEGGADG